MSNAAKLADILKRLGDAHYQAADELYGYADEMAVTQPGQATGVPVSAQPAPADDLPPFPGEPQAKSREQVFAECPVHFRPWVVKEGGVSKNGKVYKAFWKCDAPKGPDGSYCDKKPDPSWVRAHDPEKALAA